MRLTAMVIVIVAILAAGAILVLGAVPISPTTQKVELAVPDDNLPH